MHTSSNNSRRLRKTTFLLLLILLCSCGGHEKNTSKRTKELGGFEDAVSLGEIKTPVEQAPEKKSEKPVPIEPQTEKNELVQDADPEALSKLLEDEKNSSAQSSDEIKELVEDTLTSSPVRDIPAPFKMLKKLNSKVVALDSYEGSLIAATRYALVSFTSGKEKTILNQEIYKKTFSDDMPAISTIGASHESGLWIGFTNGGILQYHNNSFILKNGGPTQKKQKIEVIKEIAGRIFIGSKGFYEWDKHFDRFMSNDDIKDDIVTDIAQLNDESFLFTTLNSVYKMSLKDRTSKPLYKSFTGDYPIRSLVVESNNIYIGGRQGVLVLNSLGSPILRFGAKHSINKMLTLKKDKLVFINANEELKFISLKKIIDTESNFSHIITMYVSLESIYLGTSSGEILSASASDLDELFSAEISKKDPLFSKKYANACDAAQELLKKQFYSRQISAPVIDKKRYVFFNGNQVCPSHAGYMKADGSTAIIHNNEIELFEYGNRKGLKLPNNIEPDDILKVFLDSKNSLYLGTKKGLYISRGNEWNQVRGVEELNTDQITDIIEDKRGNIWATSRIQANNELKDNKTDYKPLHIKVNSDDWVSFGHANGISGLGISSMREHDDGIYFSNASGYFIIYANSKLAHYSQAHGLKNYIVENINLDSNNRLWLTHGYFQNGVSWIDKSSYYNTTKEDGLFANRIIETAEDDDDLIWIMDSSGEVGVYSYGFLENIAKKSVFYSSRVTRTDFLP